MRGIAGNVELGETSLSEGELQPQARPSSPFPGLLRVLGPLHCVSINKPWEGEIKHSYRDW